MERYVHVPPRPDAAVRSAHGRALSRVAACRASRSRGGPTTVETAIQEDNRQRRPGPNSFTAIGETTVDSETAQTFAGEGAASDAGYLAERGAVVAPATGRTFVIGARQVQPAHPE